MRTSPAIVSVVLAFVLLSAAIPGAAAEFTSVGFKGGLCAATLHGDLPTDPFVSNATRYGFGGGVSLTFAMGGAFSIQPEILYVMKGTSLGSVDITDPGGNVLGTADLTEAVDYIEIPILARFGPTASGSLSPYLLVGPSIGVRLSQQLELSGSTNVSGDIDLFRSADLGITLGPGVELGRGGARALLEARYTLGLTDAGEDTYSTSARNGALLVLAGISVHK